MEGALSTRGRGVEAPASAASRTCLRTGATSSGSRKLTSVCGKAAASEEQSATRASAACVVSSGCARDSRPMMWLAHAVAASLWTTGRAASSAPSMCSAAVMMAGRSSVLPPLLAAVTGAANTRSLMRANAAPASAAWGVSWALFLGKKGGESVDIGAEMACDAF